MNQPLIIERRIKKPVDKVWEALTKPESLSRWFFEIAEFKAELGFQFKLTGINEGVNYPSTCTIVEVEPKRLLSYTWAFDDYPGITTVIIELTASGNETLLKLTHKGLETLPKNHPHFESDNFITGWTYVLDRLTQLLEKEYVI